LLLAILLLPGIDHPAFAMEPEEEAEEYHRHHLSVLVGGAVRDEEETETGFGGGFEYEYRFSRWLGVGVLAEAVSGDLRDVLAIAPISLHPWRGLRLVAAPGAEISKENDAVFAFRLGVGYEFEFGRFTVAPEYNADLVEGTPTHVFGLAFGVGF